MKVITEKTLIPISLVITIIGGTLWLSALWYDNRANAKNIEVLKVDQKLLAEELVETQKKMIESLTRIETKLDIKKGQ